MNSTHVNKQLLLSLAFSVRARITSICKKIDEARSQNESEASKAWLAALKAQRKKNNQLLNLVDLYVEREIDKATPEDCKKFVEECYQAFRESSIE